MDSLDQQVEYDSGCSQQTRLSSFFKNVHSKFPGLSFLSKKDPKVEDVVITSQCVRKKPLIVIGNFTGTVGPSDAECRKESDTLDGLPTPPLPATVWSNVNEVDSKKGITIIQDAQRAKQDSTLTNPHTVTDAVAEHSNGDAAEQPNAGAGTKRRATEVEDVTNKRIDARIREVPFPTSYSNVFPNTKPSKRNEPESLSILRGSDEENVKTKVSVKKVTWEQDSDWIHEPSATPALAVPDSLKEGSKVESAKDVIVQQNRNRVQAPPSGSSILPSDSSSQDGPLCQMEGIRVDIDAGKTSKEGLFNDPSTEFSTDEIDSEKCTTSGRRQKKNVNLGDNWSLPVDLKGDLFSSKLKEILSKPFDSKETSEMWDLATRRKPVLKLRQTRGRTMHVPSKDEGLSYLDHHPDLAKRIKESSHPAEKLALLRAFFFWLQHSCMEGAYKPWAPETKNCTQEGDCVFTDGPDCEVLAVVLPLDEKNEVSAVVKPLEPVVIDLSDDDEDDCVEVSMKSPVKAVPKTNFCENLQKIATCICCFKEFGMEKDQQRALHRACGHIETCMKCVDRLWMVDKRGCLRCGVIQSMKPGSLFEFAAAAD